MPICAATWGSAPGTTRALCLAAADFKHGNLMRLHSFNTMPTTPAWLQACVGLCWQVESLPGGQPGQGSGRWRHHLRLQVNSECMLQCIA